MRALVLAIGLALMLPAVAWGKPRVAIVEFDNDPGGELSDVVAELLEGDYAIYLTPQLSRGSMVMVSDVWGHYHSRIIDDFELISAWAATHE